MDMAAYGYEDYGDLPEGSALAAAINWAGAILSVALIAGLATWGWQLWVRDVTGIPVVRALEGPMRVAPEDPGGQTTEYQGLAVNRIAEERSSDQMADRVILAPQPSVLDEDEDLAMAELAPVENPVAYDPMETADDTTLVEVAPTLSIETSPNGSGPSPQSEAIAAVDGETVQPSEPMSATDIAVAAALGGVLESVAAEQPPVILAAAHVPRATPRPEMRPLNAQRVSAPAVDATSGEIDASTIPSGTRLVQLGAYGSLEMARSEWARTEARFGDYMVGKERVVQEAQTGGRSFYRLRAIGFSGLQDARRFCAVLVADGANCIPVVQE